jgi:hypothetical protein
MQIWYELQRAGEAGLTLDELIDRVRPRVPVGYAWRRYKRYRQADVSKRKGASSSKMLEDTPSARAAAIRYAVRSSAQGMLRDHSAIRRPDRRYAMGVRKPKSVFTDEQHDFDGTLSRKQVAIMEMLRGARALVAEVETNWKPNHKPGDMPTLTVAFYALTKRLVEAHTPQP